MKNFVALVNAIAAYETAVETPVETPEVETTTVEEN